MCAFDEEKLKQLRHASELRTRPYAMKSKIKLRKSFSTTIRACDGCEESGMRWNVELNVRAPGTYTEEVFLPSLSELQVEGPLFLLTNMRKGIF